MTNTLIKSFACLNLIAASLAVSGCGGGEAYNKRHYVLNVDRQAETAKAGNEFILEVRRFTIDSAFSSKDMVHRVGESEYKTDFYNEFLVSPASMITEKTRAWLSHSGLFHRVLDKGGYVEPTHTLGGNITALHGDFRDTSSPTAVMELRVFLIENKAPEGSIFFSKTYSASASLRSSDAQGTAEALNACFEKILTDLEKDIGAKL